MKVVLQSGGGKDSIFALYEFRRSYPDAYVSGMLVTITRDFSRVSMHGVREKLIERQAESMGLKLFKSYIPRNASNEVYIDATLSTLRKIAYSVGLDGVIFGDIFLEDIRKFREELLKRLDLKPIFPLWRRDTRKLAEEFVDLGFRTVVVVIDRTRLSEEFLCREFDRSFLNDLPSGVDPMGENGEFHTFVYDGPTFDYGVKFNRGGIHRSGDFSYCDLTIDR